MSLYNIRSLSEGVYMIAKFDVDYNVEATYTITVSDKGTTCDCPANNRSVITKLCRHRQMFPVLRTAVDTDRFYDYDKGMFCEPLGDLLNVGEAPRAEAARAEIDVIKQAFALVGEAPGLPTPAEPPLVQGVDRTATQMEEDARKLYEPVQRAAEAMLEPIVNSVHAIALAQPAPTIRRR